MSRHVDGRVYDVRHGAIVQGRVRAQQVVEEVIACPGLQKIKTNLFKLSFEPDCLIGS